MPFDVIGGGARGARARESSILPQGLPWLKDASAIAPDRSRRVGS
jgi:hypothetical protein